MEKDQTLKETDLAACNRQTAHVKTWELKAGKLKVSMKYPRCILESGEAAQ